MPNKRRPEKIRASTAKEVSVLAWIQDAFGQVLLIQQTANRQLWSLPGGKVRSREPIRRALRRELKEETGLSVVSARIIDIFDRPQKGAVAILFHVTLRKGRLKLDRDEIQDARFVNRLPSRATPVGPLFLAAAVARSQGARFPPLPARLGQRGFDQHFHPGNVFEQLGRYLVAPGQELGRVVAHPDPAPALFPD